MSPEVPLVSTVMEYVIGLPQLKRRRDVKWSGKSKEPETYLRYVQLLFKTFWTDVWGLEDMGHGHGHGDGHERRHEHARAYTALLLHCIGAIFHIILSLTVFFFIAMNHAHIDRSKISPFVFVTHG